MNRFLGSEPASLAIEDLVLSAGRQRSGTLATMLTFVALWFGATGVFTQIKGGTRHDLGSRAKARRGLDRPVH